MNDFFQEDNYKIPTTSNYMKFQEGDNAFRALSSAITGFQYFNTDNKPVRSKEEPEDVSDMKQNGTVKHFWAFVVWNYQDKRIQILEITQKGIMKTMQSYIKNPNWGNPRAYDFIVTKTGANLDTEYSVSVNPKSPLDESVFEKYESMNINLEALYEGKDPFENK